MILSDYIKQLEKVLETNGDCELVFSVKDYYTTYGRYATSTINTDGGVWSGVACNKDAKTVTLTLHLNSENGKNPKITYRQ